MLLGLSEPSCCGVGGLALCTRPPSESLSPLHLLSLPTWSLGSSASLMLSSLRPFEEVAKASHPILVNPGF